MAFSGRLLRVRRNGVLVAGARTDNLTINNEVIDVTDKDDAGWRTLLGAAGMRTVTADVEGLLLDSSLIRSALGVFPIQIAGDVQIDGVGVLAGVFVFTSMALGAEQGDAVTFTATFESSGAITFTPA